MSCAARALCLGFLPGGYQNGALFSRLLSNGDTVSCEGGENGEGVCAVSVSGVLAQHEDSAPEKVAFVALG